MNPPQVPRLWLNWLLAASAGTALFGLILVLAPSLTRQSFSLLLYGEPAVLEAFGTHAARYISLAHAVLGGVMTGWGILMFFIAREFLARGSRAAWRLLLFSLCAWFVPDTAYSLASGFWQNALLNACLALAFGIPLFAMRPHLRDDL